MLSKTDRHLQSVRNAALARKSELHTDHTWKRAPGSWLAARLTRRWYFKVWLLIYKSWNGWRDGISPRRPAATLKNKGTWASATLLQTRVSPEQMFPGRSQGKLSLVLTLSLLSNSPHLGWIGHFAKHVSFSRFCMCRRFLNLCDGYFFFCRFWL